MAHMARKAKRVRQLELALHAWGGAREGAGRKPAGERERVSHSARPVQAGAHPVHVTVRLRDGLPNLRRDATRAALESVFAAGAERFGFRLVHYSIQSNHLHFVVEAANRNALSRGMQGLLVRVARRLNKVWPRRGSVFAEHFHSRTLPTPREVRHTLAYVLCNARRHGLRIEGVDRFSSGAVFDGWSRRPPPGRVSVPRTTAAPKTWLLRAGWRRHGLIGLDESPVRRSRRA